MRPAILLARREDGGRRDLIWEFCQRRWQEQLGWPIYAGVHDESEGPFSFSVGANRAAKLATEADPGWDVALYIGSDWVAADAWQVERACEVALRKGQLCFAHSTTRVYDEPTSSAFILGDPAAPLPDDGFSAHSNTFSGVVAVPRSLWDLIGGFDERFVGWGWEDLAFWSACTAVAGDFERVTHAVIAHLWHPTDRAQREDAPTHGPNQVLGERYLASKWNRTAMLKILREPDGPLDR